MKNLVVIAAIAAAAFSASAAAVDWNVTGTSAQEGYTVYLLTSVGDYADTTALANAAVGSATIASLGRGKYGTGDQSPVSAKITTDSMKDAYYAIVSSADASSFTYVSLGDMSSYVYDAAAQQNSPGTYTGKSAAQILAGTSKNFGGSTPTPPGPGPIPEPTSGLLLLVGGAMLALRRKQK